MKRVAIILTLLVASISFTFGQSGTDPITLKKVTGGYQFFQADKMLTANQLVNAVKSNEQAYTIIKTAKSSYSFASVLGFAGGALVGWPLGTAMGGGEPEWAMAGLGAGLILIAIPISQNFNKKAKEAVDLYNGGLKESSFWDKNELRVTSTRDGVGLTLVF